MDDGPFPDAVQDILSAQENALDGVCFCDLSLAIAADYQCRQGFQSITGHELGDLMGKSCRIMQGAESDVASMQLISDAMKSTYQEEAN